MRLRRSRRRRRRRGGRRCRRGRSRCRRRCASWSWLCRWRRRRFRRFGLFGSCAPQQHGRTLVVIHPARGRRHRLLPCRHGLDRIRRLPSAVGPPYSRSAFIFPVLGGRYGKQSQRNSGAYAFINRVGPERHGHGISLVGAGIVIFAVDQNGDGNQARLAIGSEFEQTQRSRSLAGIRSMSGLRQQDRRQSRLQKKAQSEDARDDAPPGGAV